jgi:hypothetical protein
VLQQEYIDEPESGACEHVKEPTRHGMAGRIPAPAATHARDHPRVRGPDAPANRLDILRGLA